MKSRLKNALKKIPAVDRVVGLFRYIQYRRALSDAMDLHPVDSDLPPPQLRYRVHRSFDIEEYLSTGRAIASSISQAFSGAGLDIARSTVLDLGSGPGRVARWLKSDFPSVRMTCADIDDEAIHWAKDHTPGIASFVATPHMPPTQFESCLFDAVYCISLFTHLDEHMQDSWLQEIARLLRPGGLLLATTHGELATASCSAAELSQLRMRGFLFRKESARRVKLDGLPEFYQTTFHSKRYVLEHWSKYFEIVSYVPGGIQHHQDVVVLRKRFDSSPS